jgi:hypothetical protein
VPRGPNGERRPADAIGLAVMVGRIATGDEVDILPKRGSAGGQARASALAPEDRQKIAEKAALTRWRK